MRQAISGGLSTGARRLKRRVATILSVRGRSLAGGAVVAVMCSALAVPASAEAPAAIGQPSPSDAQIWDPPSLAWRTCPAAAQLSAKLTCAFLKWVAP